MTKSLNIKIKLPNSMSLETLNIKTKLLNIIMSPKTPNTKHKDKTTEHNVY
jgi:hypothetical protein